MWWGVSFTWAAGTRCGTCRLFPQFTRRSLHQSHTTTSGSQLAAAGKVLGVRRSGRSIRWGDIRLGCGNVTTFRLCRRTLAMTFRGRCRLVQMKLSPGFFRLSQKFMSYDTGSRPTLQGMHDAKEALPPTNHAWKNRNNYFGPEVR